MKIGITAFLALSFLLPSVAASANQDMYGVWLTSGGRSKVEVKNCGGSVCANIIWLKNPFNSAGEPLYDRRNEAVELRERPVMGILVLRVKQIGDNAWRGKVYDPERGKTFPADVKMVKRGVMRVTGCGLGGLVCKSKDWQKISGPPQPTGLIQARPNTAPSR